jgi:hypothetical protein
MSEVNKNNERRMEEVIEKLKPQLELKQAHGDQKTNTEIIITESQQRLPRSSGLTITFEVSNKTQEEITIYLGHETKTLKPGQVYSMSATQISNIVANVKVGMQGTVALTATGNEYFRRIKYSLLVNNVKCDAPVQSTNTANGIQIMTDELEINETVRFHY